LTPPEQALEAKHIMKVAARLTQDTEAAMRPFGEIAQSALHIAAARAVHFNDRNLANYILKKHTDADKVFFLDQGVVTLRNPTTFSKKMDDIKLARLQKIQAEVEIEFANLPDTLANRKKKHSKIKTLRRLSKLWIPLGRTLKLNGVRLSTGAISRGDSMDDVLFSDWQPTFAHFDIDEGKANSFLELFAEDMAWDAATPISETSIDEYTQRCAHSAPGPDGLPYLAWKILG
jgi:hypothetical protein